MTRRLYIACIYRCIGILLCCCTLVAHAQDTDSLLQVARHYREASDLNQAMSSYFQAADLLGRQSKKEELSLVYQEIGEVYTQVGLHKKATEYYELSLEQNPSRVEVVEALANAYFLLQTFDKSMEQYSQALGFKLQSGNRQGALPIMEKLVICFHELGNYRQALANEQAVLEMSQALGDSADITTSYNNLGYDYSFVGNYDQALYYFQQALDGKKRIGAANDKIVPILLNIAIVEQNRQNYGESITTLLKAVDMVEGSKHPALKAKVLQLASEVYYNKGDYYNAEVYNEQLLDLLDSKKQPERLSKAYLMASNIHKQAEEYEQAFQAYEQHLQLRDSIRLAERLSQQSLLQQQVAYERAEKEIKLIMADKERSELEAAQKQLMLEKKTQQVEALERQKALQEAKIRQQELEKQQTEQAQQLLQQKLASQTQAQKLDSLQQQEAIQRAELAKQEAEKKERQAEIRKLSAESSLKAAQAAKEREAAQAQQRFFLTLGILGLIVVALVLWAFFNTRKKNRELAIQQKLIQDRNIELSQMNEEVSSQRDAVAAASEQLNIAYSQITDSVRYAQRIQQSILFPPEEITQHFHDGFIFFLPRDIVSGDFYWFAKKGDKLVVTAIDCTGHGVPGAFMSLIGNDLLNDIVNLRDITDPARILDELSEGVRRTLKQDQNDNQDGMDMALCVVDQAEQQLYFAGAKNPLIYIQNGEIHRIKGDKMAIGGKRLYAEQKYQTHTVPLNTPTRFYLFSDGYQDQFGGPRNKKFMVKRLRELLLNIHEMPMEQQHARLRQTLKEWQGTETQVDDILLMGFEWRQ